MRQTTDFQLFVRGLEIGIVPSYSCMGEPKFARQPERVRMCGQEIDSVEELLVQYYV